MQKLFIAALAAFVLSGCATGMGGNMLPVSNGVIGAAGTAESAVVKSIRVVRVVQQSRGSTYVGTAVGAAAGSAIGSKIGKGNGRKLAVLMGGVIGGSMGHSVASSPDLVPAHEIEIVVESTGKYMVVTQAISGEQLMPGQRVRLINYGGKFRVVS